MMFRSSCLLAILSILSSSDAFTIGRTNGIRHEVVTVSDQSPFSAPHSTSLCMSEEGTTEESPAQGEAEETTNAADDILSSPAFLKRKLEVLETDIAKTEEDLVAATERKEVAKEEWGPQLEALQREVSL